MGKLRDAQYHLLCNLSKKITDYQSGSSNNQPDEGDIGDIDEYGVNVEFDDSDESEQEDLNYIRPSDDSDDDNDEEMKPSGGGIRDEADRGGDDDDDEDLIVQPREVDAFWLQVNTFIFSMLILVSRHVFRTIQRSEKILVNSQSHF